MLTAANILWKYLVQLQNKLIILRMKTNQHSYTEHMLQFLYSSAEILPNDKNSNNCLSKGYFIIVDC